MVSSNTSNETTRDWITLEGNGGFATTLVPGDTLIVSQTTNQAVALWACSHPSYVPLSLSQTRGHLRRLHIKEGDVLVNANKEAMLRISADSSMGRHDSHLPASLEAEDALKAALASEGVDEENTAYLLFIVFPFL